MNYKNLHVKVDEQLFNEVSDLLPFQGGISLATRIALKNFVRDMRSGKIKLTGTGDTNEDSKTDRTD